MTKRVALYTCVSTNNGKQTTENQLRDLHMMAERIGWEIVAHYTDEGISGARGRRSLRTTGWGSPLPVEPVGSPVTSSV